VQRFLILALLLAASASARAQDIFVAPTYNSVLASAEAGIGEEGVQDLIVTNRSTVPIIVFGLTYSACDNLKQSCGGHRLNIKVPAGQRRNVGRAQPKDHDKGFGYRWTFSFVADSSDAKMLAALREHGLLPAPSGAEHAVAGTPVPVDVTPSTPSAPSSTTEQPVSREPLTEAERSGGESIVDRERAGPTTLRFKVGYGSIIGSTMMPGTPVLRTGSCVDPRATAAYDANASITRTPWHPSSVAELSRIVLPYEMRDSIPPNAEVLVRFVTDTTGVPIPESVSILDSPSGALSLRMCTRVMSAHTTPARDKNGHAIRAWTQLAVSIPRF
jgi:hypothetical protein